MGWSSGSSLMGKVMFALREREVSFERRKTFYEVLIPAMEDMDWDNGCEVVGEDPAFDEVYGALHPEESDD